VTLRCCASIQEPQKVGNDEIGGKYYQTLGTVGLFVVSHHSTIEHGRSEASKKRFTYGRGTKQCAEATQADVQRYQQTHQQYRWQERGRVLALRTSLP
jgi:NADH:ubiquinone oxidoreductase subunit